MPVAAKRINLPGVEDPAARKQADADAALADLTERCRIHDEQLAAYRVDCVTYMQRFGKGSAMWAERSWVWEAPAEGSEPETWPPLARLLWLWEQAQYCISSIGQLRTADRPGWCPECHEEGEKMRGTWFRWSCLRHNKSGEITVTWTAAFLFGGKS